MNRFDVESIIVLKIATKDIIPPRTEYKPKSSFPNACSVNRVVSKAHIVVIAILPYNTIVLTTIALFVFSCINC